MQNDPFGSCCRDLKNALENAGNYVNARSIEEAWATELSRNGQAIDPSSDVRIVDEVGTYWQTLGFGDRGFYVNYCTVDVWQRNVVFKVNGELKRATVNIWSAQKVVMALPEQQSSQWNVANLGIPSLAKEFARGR